MVKVLFSSFGDLIQVPSHIILFFKIFCEDYLEKNINDTFTYVVVMSSVFKISILLLLF